MPKVTSPKQSGSRGDRQEDIRLFRQAMADFALKGHDKFIQEMNTMTGRDYCQMYLLAAKYVAPAYSDVTLDEELVKSSYRDILKEVTAYKEK